jgi:exocyst complex component 1
LKLTWHLNEIKSITCLNTDNLNGFEFIFNNNSSQNEQSNRYVWKCEAEQECTNFLHTLWKLSEEFLKASDRPKFKNCNFDKVLIKSIQNELDNSKNENKSNKINSNQFELSKSEEESLLKLMSECDFASSNAESFMRKLEADLLYLDTSNIESIMNSEENTLKLIEMLDVAVSEIDKIDQRLQIYEEKINAVGDAVRIVGERDNVIQLQQNNQHALLDLLENMMNMLEFTQDQHNILNECDLSSAKKIDRCVAVANQLLEIIDTNLPIGKIN